MQSSVYITACKNKFAVFSNYYNCVTILPTNNVVLVKHFVLEASKVYSSIGPTT